MERLFRALMIVLMDNATAEYAFIRQFFKKEEQNLVPVPPTPSTAGSISLILGALEQDGSSVGTPGAEQQARQPQVPLIAPAIKSPFFRIATDEDKAIDSIWKDVVDPILQYADVRLFIYLVLFSSH